jgi:hypothetical protein
MKVCGQLHAQTSLTPEINAMSTKEEAEWAPQPARTAFGEEKIYYACQNSNSGLSRP